MVSLYMISRVVLYGTTLYSYYQTWEWIRFGCSVLLVTYDGTKRVYQWIYSPQITNDAPLDDWLVL